MNSIGFYALIKPLLIYRLVKGAFQACFRVFAIIKTFDNVPGFVALGKLHESFFANIANHQVVVVIGG